MIRPRFGLMDRLYASIAQSGLALYGVCRARLSSLPFTGAVLTFCLQHGSETTWILQGQYLPLRNEIRRAMDEVCDAQALILGPHVEKFEKHLAAYCQTKHAIGVSSGTDALLWPDGHRHQAGR